MVNPRLLVLLFSSNCCNCVLKYRMNLGKIVSKTYARYAVNFFALAICLTRVT